MSKILPLWYITTMPRPKNAFPTKSQVPGDKEKTTILLNTELKKKAIKSLYDLGFQTLTPMIEEGLRIQLKRLEAKKAKG